MTTTTLATEATATTTDRRPAVRIPFTTVVAVELRKMFDTRSGFWMLASIVTLSVLATGAVILWAPDSAQGFGTYASAIGIPMSVVLPMIAVLGVTSEWSQRSGLTTFTLVPHRGRVVGAKLTGTVAVGVAAMAVALAVGAVANAVGSTVNGVDVVWDVSAVEFARIVLASVLGMLVGFTLGVLFRNSAGAIVGYFVYAFVLPTLSNMLAALQEWWRDVQPWVDFQLNQTGLYDGDMTGSDWARLAVTGTVWLVLPLAFGLWRVVRAEVA